MAQQVEDAVLPPPPIAPPLPWGAPVATMPQNGLLPPSFNPYAAPQAASTDPGQAFSNFGSAIHNAPIPGVAGIGDYLGIGSNSSPNLGAAVGRPGTIGDLYGGVTAGGVEGALAAFGGVAPMDSLGVESAVTAAKQLAPQALAGLSEAAPKAAGSFADAMGARLPQAVSAGREVPASSSGLFTVKELAPDTHVVITPSGKTGPIFSAANGFTGDTAAAAQAAADKLNGSSIAGASAAFNAATGLDRNAILIQNAAKDFSKQAKQDVRQAIRGDGLESLTPVQTNRLNTEGSAILQARGIPNTPENMTALGNELHSAQAQVNQITRANGRAPTPREANTDTNTAAVRQTVSDVVNPKVEAPKVDTTSESFNTVPGETPQAGAPAGPQEVTPTSVAGAETPSGIPAASPAREPLVNTLLREALGVTRSTLITGHLAALRQMLPGLTYAGSKGRVDIIGRAIGAMAHGAISDGASVAERIGGLKQSLADVGLDKSVFLNHPNAHVSQSEEAMLVGRLSRTPAVTSAVGAVSGYVGADPNSTTQQRLERAAKGAAIGAAVGLSAGRLNQAYGMGINSLRTDLALNLAKQYQKIGNTDPITGKLGAQAADKVGHFVNILTGRGDLVEKLAGKAGPDAKEAAKSLQDAASGVFFGPRLMTSTWQQAADTIGALHGIVPDTAHAILSGKPLDPARLATIQSTASFVAFGAGLMAIAKSQGLQIGTDTNKSDWGLIHLPDGATVDMWGAYRTGARDVAQEINYAKQVATNTVPKGPFAKTGISIAGNYLRSHLNPPAGVGVDYLSGKTAMGQPPSLDPINPVTHPPFGVATGEYAFGAGNAHQPPGPGGLLGAGETALTALGAGVQPPNLTPKRDALGRIDDGALPATPVTDAWAKAQANNPNLGDLKLPDRNIGTGQTKIVLDDKETDQLRVLTGTVRSTLMAQVVASPAFQSAKPDKQEKLLVGANLEAERQGQVAFALDHAKNATDEASRVRAATIGWRSTNSIGSKMDFLSQLQQGNALTETVHAALDDSRSQSDPLKPKYEPSVSEYLKGNDLVNQYVKSPAFVAGQPQDWAEATKQGAALHAMYQTLVAEASQKSTAVRKVTVDQLPDYANYIKDWTTARTSSGRAVSAFITKTGNVNTALVSPQRLAIEKDPLFQHFIAVAHQRDPYSIK